MSSIYSSVQGNHPPKNKFDLSHSHFMTMKVGKLYPAMCKEVYPGDVFKISDAVHCELQPMVAPLLSDLNMYAHTFFVPYRLLYGVDNTDGSNLWEKFITGGDDGDYDTPLPSWTPDFSVAGFSSDTIWDSVGNPVSLSTSGAGTEDDPVVYTWTPIVPADLLVSKAPKLAYNRIWNDFYRDENLQDEVDEDNEYLLYRDWRKDYFTSALESQQFGTAPALPVDVSFSVPSYSPLGFFYPSTLFSSASVSGSSPVSFNTVPGTAPTLSSPVQLSADPNGGSAMLFAGDPLSPMSGVTGSVSGSNFSIGLSSGVTDLVTIDSSSVTNTTLNSSVSATTFNVNDMRLVFAIQRLMELSMRGGHRYTEYLHAHYGVSPTDARLDRPEYIGGAVFPINVSVSVQNSETANTPQGNKVGIGNINDIQKVGSYRVEEYGLIMTLVSIVPKPCYMQGISREWLRQTRFSYYHPEFANISEQGIFRAEIYVDPTDSTYPDNGIFGYQAAWNEMRAANNFVSGAMREQFDYWLMARKFASRPALNEDFVSLAHPSEYNRIWAVQDEDQFIVAFSNIIEAYRPIPAFGTPGLIDHVYGNK